MYRRKRKDKEIKYTRGDKKRERERGEKGEHERVSGQNLTSVEYEDPPSYCASNSFVEERERERWWLMEA